MNWYKESQSSAPIQLLGFEKLKGEVTGTMFALLQGRRYPYKGVYQKEYDHIGRLLSHKNFSAAGTELSRLKKRQENSQQQLTPRGYTPDEEGQMMDQLFDGKDQQLLF